MLDDIVFHKPDAMALSNIWNSGNGREKQTQKIFGNNNLSGMSLLAGGRKWTISISGEKNHLAKIVDNSAKWGGEDFQHKVNDKNEIVDEEEPKKKYEGITLAAGNKKWRADLWIFNRKHYIVMSADKEEARRARVKVVKHKAAIVKEASLISDESKRYQYVMDRIAELVQEEVKNSKKLSPGVTYYAKLRQWQVKVKMSGRQYHVGYYKCIEEALCARGKVEQEREAMLKEAATLPVDMHASYINNRIRQAVGRDRDQHKKSKQGQSAQDDKKEYYGVSYVRRSGAYWAYVHILAVKHRIGRYLDEDAAWAARAKVLQQKDMIESQALEIDCEVARKSFIGSRIGDIVRVPKAQPKASAREQGRRINGERRRRISVKSSSANTRRQSRASGRGRDREMSLRSTEGEEDEAEEMDDLVDWEEEEWPSSRLCARARAQLGPEATMERLLKHQKAFDEKVTRVLEYQAAYGSLPGHGFARGHCGGEMDGYGECDGDGQGPDESEAEEDEEEKRRMLSSFVFTQRMLRRSGALPAERVSALEAIDGFTW